MENTRQAVPVTREDFQTREKAFFYQVYNWMAAGLALTGGIAYLVSNSPAALSIIFGNQLVFFGLIIGELALVWSLASRIDKIEPQTASSLFFLYAGINGLTMAAIFIMYTTASIASTFFICGATFAATSMYGASTKRDLTGIGNFMFMGLIGIIIASVVNMFLRNPMIYWLISYIGVAVFVGLTAYDTQKIKAMARNNNFSAQENSKMVVMAALTLYLDFINLFIFLLQIMGNARD
ncbi:MAG: Bax inhibitor-1/YccA family protein [bacterium]